MTKESLRKIVDSFDKEFDVLILIRNDKTGEAFIDGFGCARCLIEFLNMWAHENRIDHIGQEAIAKEKLN